MDFLLTEEQQLLRKTVRDFATQELEPIAQRIDEREEFPWESMKKLAKLGLTGIGIDPKYGGSGGDEVQLAIAVEEIARACASTSAVYLVTLSLGAHCIYHFGNEEQKLKYVVPLAKGEHIGAFSLSEPNSGSDAAALETRAVKKNNTYILNGSKIFTTNGDVADTIILFATVDKALGSHGVTAFILEQGTPGLTATKQEGKMGIRGSSTAELWLEDCPVPLENRMGEEGEGFKIAMKMIDSSRTIVAAQALGIAQAALEMSLRYAKNRHQFGKPIAEFQAIQWMLADMATNINAARLLVFQAASLKDRGLPYFKESAMAKLFASETAMAAANKAIQIYGGYGYFRENTVERLFRDAKVTEIYEGTSEIQRLVISRHILKETPV